VLSIQECGGIGKTVEAGVKAVADLLPVVSEYRRVELPAKHLMLGTNCGGSDGNSGVTANPALGVASDLIGTRASSGWRSTTTRRSATRRAG
jgi:altronate hydrolase